MSRLAGGIISYTRELEQRKLAENSEIHDANGDESDEGHGFSMVSVNENESKVDSSLVMEVKADIESEKNEIVVKNSNENDQTIHLTRNIDGSKFKVNQFLKLF